MAITATKITATIVLSGAAQEATTQSIMGRIDHLILESTIQDSEFDLVLKNANDQEIYRKDAVHMTNGVISDIRPQILPYGAVTISLENPIIGGETITVTIIEKQRES